MGNKIFFGIVIVILIIVWGYFNFERYLTETEIEITIVNSAKYADEPGKYLIFTPHEVFLNENNSWQDKYNADELFTQLQKGEKYKVKVVGSYIPYISEFRNIVEIVSKEEVNKTTRY